MESKKTMSCLKAVLAILATLSFISLVGRWSTSNAQCPNNAVFLKASQSTGSGATGERFRGKKTRDFPVEKIVSFDTALREKKSTKTSVQKKNPNCDKWVVITTIYEPSDAIHIVANHLLTRQEENDNKIGWCMVIVADTKTPENYISSVQWSALQLQHFVYLTVDDQEKMAQEIPFVATMPYRSFARKNVGYLYAIQQGAKIILDLDDDNELKVDEQQGEGVQLIKSFTPPTTNNNGEESSAIPVRQYDTNAYPHRVVNPFPRMGATVSGTWPRGFPLNLVQSQEALGKVVDQETTLPLSQVGVIQSVCNHDPDVDAVYRLTRPLPFIFSSGNNNDNTVSSQTRSLSSLVIPRTLYVPYNAQATLHYPNAYWGMYLPITVTGRVSDIWRSYFMQRIMRELEQPLYLLYSAPMVTQIRNAHDYIGDMAAEDHLYMRTEPLLEFLDEWKPSSTRLPLLVQDLWIQLYERQYVEEEDVVAVQRWLLALQEGGYQFPSVQKKA